MRNTFAEEIYLQSIRNKNIYVLVADISPAGKINKFQKNNPKNFLNVGVSEQTMIGVSAGLAMEGKRVFAYTISTFSLYRPFEMIRVDLCYQNLPVTIVGMGAGTIYSNLGGTHLTQEDISVARSVPNLNIIAPCDPLELKEAIKFCANKSRNPIYLRIGKTGEKNYTKNSVDKWKFGNLRKIQKGKDLCFLSFGPIIKKAFDISKKLSDKGINPEIYSCHTLKPFDFSGLKNIFKKFKRIIVVEDHSKIGGLASIVKQHAFECEFKGKIISFSLKDKFLNCFGSQQDLLDLHGIKKKKIYESIINFLK